MYCTECGEADGVHEPGCKLMAKGWDELTRKAPNLQDALEARGYLALLCVGVGTRQDGMASIKIAANPGVRNLRNTREWYTMRLTIFNAIDKLMTSELDDLELER